MLGGDGDGDGKGFGKRAARYVRPMRCLVPLLNSIS